MKLGTILLAVALWLLGGLCPAAAKAAMIQFDFHFTCSIACPEGAEPPRGSFSIERDASSQDGRLPVQSANVSFLGNEYSFSGPGPSEYRDYVIVSGDEVLGPVFLALWSEDGGPFGIGNYPGTWFSDLGGGHFRT